MWLDGKKEKERVKIIAIYIEENKKTYQNLLAKNAVFIEIIFLILHIILAR